MKLFNTREDLDAASGTSKYDTFMQLLAASINRWEWSGSAWVQVQDTSTIERFGFIASDFPNAPVPPQPTTNPGLVTASMVVAERQRRLDITPLIYDFGDARGVHEIGLTDEDRVGWDEVTKLATALDSKSDTTTTINIVTNTGSCQVTAPEWSDILIAIAGVRQPIWAASFVLEQQDPIPSNYADDMHWP